MRTNDVAKILGVSVGMANKYVNEIEKLGLREFKKNARGHRKYDDEDIRFIQQYVLSKSAGSDEAAASKEISEPQQIVVEELIEAVSNRSTQSERESILVEALIDYIIKLKGKISEAK